MSEQEQRLKEMVEQNAMLRAERDRDHHAADRDRQVRTPHEILEHINADHPCCIGVGDAVALLEENERLRAEPLREIVSDTLLVAMKRADAAEARIDAALAECEGTEECDVVCNLASRVVEALKGEK